jgi:hypothetical protein
MSRFSALVLCVALSACQTAAPSGAARSPADAPAQLMQLGQSKPFGVFNHHDACVWDVNSHFDDGCGYQHLNFLAEELAHDLIPFRGRYASMDESDLQIRKSLPQLGCELFGCR